MLPSNALSTDPAAADFLEPDDEVTSRLTAKELGGVGLSDASQGLQVKVWTAYYDGEKITVEADGVSPVTLLTLDDVKEIDLAFDQNMRAQIAMTVEVGGEDIGRLWWFDTLANDHVFTDFPGAKWLRLSMDDKRQMSSGQNDIILAYVRDGNLYFRAQRDRYGTEYLLLEDAPGMLRRVGMNKVLRLQFEFVPIPTEYRIVVPEDPEITLEAKTKIQMDPVPLILVTDEEDDPCSE